MKPCTHQVFDFKTKVTYLSNVERYILEAAIRCSDCGQRFAFQGLPVSPVALDGACMSPDGGLARLSIYPQHDMLPPLDDMPIASLPEAPRPALEGSDNTEPEPPVSTDFEVIE